MTTRKAIACLVSPLLLLLLLFLVLAATDAHRLQAIVERYNAIEHFDEEFWRFVLDPAPTYSGDQPRKNSLVILPVIRWDGSPPRHRALPPIKYDYEYNGTMVVHRGNRTEITEACGNNLHTLGCARLSFEGKRCDVWIVYDEILEAYDLAV